MKTSRGAYRLMRALFRLTDGGGRFRLNNQLKKILDDGRRAETRRTFKYLRMAGYINQLEGDRFQVTDLAKINMLREVVKSRRPDGKLRIVIFDIPEKLKVNRDFFRRHLVELGFKMQQQSVWASSFPCEDLVQLVVRYHGLGKYVELVIGDIRTISSAAA